MTPYDMLQTAAPVPVLLRMFDNYQDIPDDYIPYNRADEHIIYPPVFDLTGKTTPFILRDLVGNKSVYRCYITDPIGFNISGQLFEDYGVEVDLLEFLEGKKVKLSLFNFWGDLVASKVVDIIVPIVPKGPHFPTEAPESVNITIPTPAIFAGVYTGVLELLDVNNVVLTKLFGMSDATFAIDSYIENTTLTDIYVNTLPIEVVDELPAEGVVGVLYLIPTDDPEQDAYDEYLYVNGTWNKLGIVSYDQLQDIPSINGVLVQGHKNAPDYDLEYDMDDITHSQIDDIVK